ncbi:MAG: YceI family protein [Planctomycetota bacterium]|nr:MAG: YceI family protein [Planctomycetota bacterium]
MRRLFVRTPAVSFLTLILAAGTVRAASKTFDFKDPKGVNAIAFILDSKLEPIMGIAQGIAGTVRFDPDNPAEMTGTITVKASEVRCALPAMTNVLHGADWLDVRTYPTIEFTFEKIKNAKPVAGGQIELLTVGSLTIKGVTKTITVPVRVAYLPDQAGRRQRGAKGDLLVLRSNFTIRRSDFNIKPGMGSDGVAEKIELRVSIVGYEK